MCDYYLQPWTSLMAFSANFQVYNRSLVPQWIKKKKGTGYRRDKGKKDKRLEILNTPMIQHLQLSLPFAYQFITCVLLEESFGRIDLCKEKIEYRWLKRVF